MNPDIEQQELLQPQSIRGPRKVGKQKLTCIIFAIPNVAIVSSNGRPFVYCHRVMFVLNLETIPF